MAAISTLLVACVIDFDLFRQTLHCGAMSKRVAKKMTETTVAVNIIFVNIFCQHVTYR